MAKENRYFWLRLYDDFFTSKRIKKLRKLAGGDTYLIIYLKMQLIAMKHDGILQWSGLDDNFADELALELDEEPANVEVTINYLLSCGLAETSDDVTFFLPFAVKNVGSEGSSAKRMRESRARAKLEEPSQCSNDVRTLCEHRYGEKEIEKEIDIEIEKERELETGHPAPAAYGRYHNVILSDTELDGLKTELPGKWEYYIDRLSCHIASSGRKYKSHAATIFKWAQEDAAKKAPKKGIPDYTCKEGESL